MNQALFKTFKSPYHAVTLQSSRYHKVMPYFVVLIMGLPLLFVIFKSFSVYLIAQVIVFLVFPVFLWVFLNTDQVSDIKLDIIKVFVIMSLYFSYLLGLCWIMVGIFQPLLKTEYLLLSLGYIILLLIVTIITTVVFFYHRYAQKIIRSQIKTQQT